MNTSSAITLFIVLDSFGMIPLALSMLANFPVKRQIIIIIRELVLALILLVIFYFLGASILNFLGASQSDLQICSGAVLSIISMNMVFKHESESESLKTEPLLVPICTPLISGPSALATVILINAQSTNIAIDLLMIIVAWIASAIILVCGIACGQFIPKKILPAVVKLMGLLLAIIAAHSLCSGLTHYFGK